MAEMAPGWRTNVRSVSVAGVAFGLTRLLGPVLPELAGGVAERLWMSPRRPAVPERELAFRSAATPLRLPWDEGALAGWSWGDGPTVLLVHGWEGRGTQLGSFVAPLVAHGFRVVAFDAPAHGDTPGKTLVLPRFADAVTAAVRSVGPVHAIIAHSFGAPAVAYALRARLAVDAVAFVAPMDAAAAIRRFVRWTNLGPEVRRAMEERLAHRFGHRIEQFSAASLGRDQHPPLLVLHDRTDPICPVDDGEAWARTWPDATFDVTEGLGHTRILRDEGVVSAVTAFVRARARAAA
jgi:pimeloyl-ACP methyl ester carboxylesterase